LENRDLKPMSPRRRKLLSILLGLVIVVLIGHPFFQVIRTYQCLSLTFIIFGELIFISMACLYCFSSELFREPPLELITPSDLTKEQFEQFYIDRAPERMIKDRGTGKDILVKKKKVVIFYSNRCARNIR
jgi:hypothetical protein